MTPPREFEGKSKLCGKVAKRCTNAYIYLNIDYESHLMILMSKSIKINGIVAEKGTKKSSFIKIGKGLVTSTEIPVTIINGYEDGPTLCVTAGTHPCEFPGVAAITKLCGQIKPEELKGAIIAVPFINKRGFQNRTSYVNPIDNLNIEAVYPGKQDGSSSEIIAYTVLEEIVKKADYAIDCHGGDLDEMMYNNTHCPRIGDKKIDRASEALARIFGLEYICLSLPKPNSTNRTIESAKRGVPAIQTEVGSVGMLRKIDVDTVYTGITNVMKYLNMMNGRPKITVRQKLVESISRISPESEGIFIPTVDLGETVIKGQKIGEIFDVQGVTTDEIISPCDGVVRKIFTYQAVRPNRTVFEIFVSPKPVSSFPEIDPFYQA